MESSVLGLLLQYFKKNDCQLHFNQKSWEAIVCWLQKRGQRKLQSFKPGEIQWWKWKCQRGLVLWGKIIKWNDPFWTLIKIMGSNICTIRAHSENRKSHYKWTRLFLNKKGILKQIMPKKVDSWPYLRDSLRVSCLFTIDQIRKIFRAVPRKSLENDTMILT